MKVCLFHPTLLPPKNYGGVERVVLWLARGLVERGHEVWVAALKGSRMPDGVKLIEMNPGHVSAHDLLPLLPPGIEVVHFMAPPEEGVMQMLPCASLLTVHGNGKPGEIFPRNTVFLSRDHARRHRAEAFVYNGIAPDEFMFDPNRSKASWMLFLSKTSWSVKNLRGAMSLCRQARATLRIAGGNRPLSCRAMASMMPGWQWMGSVSGEKKASLLADARALVFPVLWDEPFGLVVVEAWMSGTPVIASRAGSLSELVTPEVGAVLDPPLTEGAREQWVDTLRRVARFEKRWHPEACRAWAIENFHYLKMAEGYEYAYKKISAGDFLNGSVPATQGPPQGLLRGDLT